MERPYFSLGVTWNVKVGRKPNPDCWRLNEGVVQNHPTKVTEVFETQRTSLQQTCPQPISNSPISLNQTIEHQLQPHSRVCSLFNMDDETSYDLTLVRHPRLSHLRAFLHWPPLPFHLILQRLIPQLDRHLVLPLLELSVGSWRTSLRTVPQLP